MAPQIVLISGCSSGIGLVTAVLLAKDAEKRFKVYATMRNLARKGQLEEEGKEYLGDTLIIKQMDVSSDESVKNAVQEVLDTEGKIDVLCKYIVLLKKPVCTGIAAFVTQHGTVLNAEFLLVCDNEVDLIVSRLGQDSQISWHSHAFIGRIVALTIDG